MLFSTHLIP